MRTISPDIYKTPPGQFSKLDLFLPFFIIIQFVFFVGWLKVTHPVLASQYFTFLTFQVAETLINPFGEDEDDFELNRLIDRHIQVGFLMSDPTVEKPELLRDKFWDEILPPELPYTVGSRADKQSEFRGSAEIFLEVKDEEKVYSDPGPEEVSGSSEQRKYSGLALLKRENVYESIRSAWRLQKRKSSTSSSKHLDEIRKDCRDYSNIEMKENYS